MQQSLNEFFLGRRSQLWVLGGIAISALIAANAAWLFPTLRELDNGAYALHRAIAIDVKNQIGAFLERHENALKNAVDIIDHGSASKPELISRLMKENQPFASVSILGLDGREKTKSHRFLLVTPSDFRDRSVDELFLAVSRGDIYRSPVLISGASEPLITIAVPLDRKSGYSALVAEVNLQFLLDVVRRVSAGSSLGGEAAYVVDRDGYIIAHPNSSLVFGRTNVLQRKLVLSALAGREADTRSGDLIYLNEQNEKVFAVALPFELTGWAIVAENSRSQALASSRRILSAAIVSFGLEILLLLLLVWNYFNLIKAATLFYA